MNDKTSNALIEIVLRFGPEGADPLQAEFKTLLHSPTMKIRHREAVNKTMEQAILTRTGFQNRLFLVETA